jgi:hypothetical protein
MRKRERLLLLCGLLLWLLPACTAANSEQQETVDALEQLIVTTATARAEEEISPAEELATAEADATEAAQTLEAEITEAAVTSTAASSAATATRDSLLSTAGAATAMAIINTPPGSPDVPVETPPAPVPTTDQAEQEAIAGELAAYGVDPASGQLAWMHPPVVLDVEGFQQFTLTNTVSLEPEVDFVLAADITWTTEFGAAGCGFVLRSNSFEIDSSQYLAYISRRDGGFAMFQTRFNGEFRDSETVDFPISGVDPAFQWPNESTNRLAIVAQADNFTFYVNGTRIGTAVPQTKLGEGLVAFIALNDSGRTICGFENGWLWRMN